MVKSKLLPISTLQQRFEDDAAEGGGLGASDDWELAAALFTTVAIVLSHLARDEILEAAADDRNDDAGAVCCEAVGLAETSLVAAGGVEVGLEGLSEGPVETFSVVKLTHALCTEALRMLPMTPKAAITFALGSSA